MNHFYLSFYLAILMKSVEGKGHATNYWGKFAIHKGRQACTQGEGVGGLEGHYS